MARIRRALSPIASPACAAGTHWLTITPVPLAGRSRRTADSAGTLPAPRASRTAARSRTRPAGRLVSVKTGSPRRSRAVFGRNPSPAGGRPGVELLLHDRLLEIGIREEADHERRHVRRILCVEQDPRSVHRRGHGGRGVRENRHLFVEGFYQGHAEAFVFAAAEKQVGQFVVGNQLRVRDVAREMNVLEAELVHQVCSTLRSTARRR